MKKYFLVPLCCFVLINQAIFGAGVEDTLYKRSSTTPQGQAARSGCEHGCYDDGPLEVGRAEEEPEEKVARVQEIPEEPSTAPIVEEVWEAPRSSPTYKMIPVTVSAEPCYPVCEEPEYVPCDPSPSYTWPSWTPYVLPIAIAGSALAVSAVRATDSCEDPCPRSEFTVLDFFVEASVGGNDGESPRPGSITVQILFPDLTVLDTITLSTGETSIPVIVSQFSAQTTNFLPGQEFTVVATAVEDLVNSITVDGRIDGQVFDSQTDNSPMVGLLFTFTIP